MRAWWVLAILLLPTTVAEFGREDSNGWPIGEHGISHDPSRTVEPAALATLQARGLEDDPLNRVGPATIYPYYPIVLAEVQRLAAEYPDIVKLHIAGQSEAGLDMFFLEIADHGSLEASSDPTLPLAEREVVWIDGGTHSNEFSGVYFVLAVAQYLIESYGSDEFATWVVENRHTWIMPMVNVDGSHAMGRLNANLVNINRNYPVIWDGQGHDEVMNNRGPSPASEMETQVNIEWFERLMPDYYASVHCCGNLWLFPYGEEGVDPPQDDFSMLTAICQEAFPDVLEDCGPIWSTIYPASGSSVDTAYEVSGGVSFGFEMSGRSNLIGRWGEPVTFSEVFEQERESWAGIKHALENVHRYGAHLEVIAASVQGDRLTLDLRNSGMANWTAGTFVLATEEGTSRGETDGILAGADGQVTVDWPGGNEGTLTYQERVMAAPLATTSFQVASAEATTPGPGGPMAVLAMALMALGLRRTKVT